MKSIGVIGSRELPESERARVGAVVGTLVAKGYRIHSGGALGADLYALEALLELNAVENGMIFAPWSSPAGFPKDTRGSVDRYLKEKGAVSWGCITNCPDRAAVVAALMERNERLVKYSDGIVAFLYGESKGTSFTLRRACAKDRRVVAFLCGGGATLPELKAGRWVPLNCAAPWAGSFLFKRNC